MNTMRVCAATLLFLAAGCTANPAPGTDASAAAMKNPDIITAAELEDSQVASGDVLQAIQRLRPRYLMSRGSVSGQKADAGTVHVSIDGGALLTLDNLTRLRPTAIAEIRYLSATDAAQRFGTAAGSGGVILVKSK